MSRHRDYAKIIAVARIRSREPGRRGRKDNHVAGPAGRPRAGSDPGATSQQIPAQTGNHDRLQWRPRSAPGPAPYRLFRAARSCAVCSTGSAQISPFWMLADFAIVAVPATTVARPRADRV